MILYNQLVDSEGDPWYMGFLNFKKFMLCNERSPVKVDEANLSTTKVSGSALAMMKSRDY